MLFLLLMSNTLALTAGSLEPDNLDAILSPRSPEDANRGTGDGSKPLKKLLKSDSKKKHVLKKASIRIITWLIAGNSDDIRAIIF